MKEKSSKESINIKEVHGPDIDRKSGRVVN